MRRTCPLADAVWLIPVPWRPQRSLPDRLTLNTTIPIL